MRARIRLPVLFLVLLLFFALLAVASNETLDVATCTAGGSASCSVAGLNSDDTGADGATIPKGKSVSTTWTDTTFDAASTITKVELITTHGGEAGINGQLQLTLQSSGGTPYCTFYLDNTQAQTKEVNDTTSACSWTQARLNDLDIVIANTGTAKAKALVSFIDINITYTPPDTEAPNVTATSPGNDTWDLDGDVTFQYYPIDNRDFANCTLAIDGTMNSTNTSPISNGSTNSIAVMGLLDGNHTWSVNCTDNAGNTGNSTEKTVKVDTRGPYINLHLPPDGNISTETSITFYYNASDEQTGLDACKLIVNGTVKDTDNSPDPDVQQNFTIALTNGYYEWWVNCTDLNGFQNQSTETWNITIATLYPSIAPDFASYTLGDTALIEGQNFNPAALHNFNYTLPDSSEINHSQLSEADGTINDTLYLNYSYPPGTYQVYTYEMADEFYNASSSFTVNLPPTDVTTGASYIQGQEITVSGVDYVPNTVINISINFSDDSVVSFTADTDANGDFTAWYNLSHRAPLGTADLFAGALYYFRINDSTTFDVLLRRARLTTDASTYGRDENVFIDGFNFTRFGLIELILFENSSYGTVASGYPNNFSADTSGNFSDTWNTNSYCNAVYGINASDWNNSVFNATIYFTIEELIPSSDTVSPYGGNKTDGTTKPLNISKVLSSDDDKSTLSTNTGTPWIYEFNFTNTYNRGLQIDKVTFQIEHAETGGLSNPRLQVWNNSVFTDWACPGFTTSTSDKNETCDVSAFFPTPESLDSVSIRFLEDRTAGPQTLSIDYVHLEVNTSYEPSCTYLNGTPAGGLAQNPPYVTEIAVDDSIGSPADQLDLNAGTTRTVWCNVTISDADGFGTIQSVTGVLHSTTVSVGAPDDARNHYSDASCTFIQGGGNLANYSCDFTLEYYAVNSSWNCSVTATDTSEQSDTASVLTTLNPLFALNVSVRAIEYGNLTEGDISAERFVNVTNLGNAVLNLTLLGYGAAIGDGYAVVCTQDYVAIGEHRFGLISSAFAAKTALTGGYDNTGILIEPTTDGTPSRNGTYWQLQIPGDPVLEPRGECSGTVVFQAESPVP